LVLYPRYNTENQKCESFLDPTCGRFIRGYASIDECELECLPEEKVVDEEIKYIPGKEGRCNNNAGKKFSGVYLLYLKTYKTFQQLVWVLIHRHPRYKPSARA